jgi:nicotinate-nucleotide adenylyltransferase
MPVRIPPHKPIDDEPGPDHRLALSRLAVRGDSRFEVSEAEIAREGRSFTVDTLDQLKRELPDSELFLILGADIAAGLPNWHEPEQVASLATVAVAERPGTSGTEVREALARVRGGERACFFEMPTIGISSTLIRRRVGSGLPIRYLVPEPVADYVAEHALYVGKGSR